MASNSIKSRAGAALVGLALATAGCATSTPYQPRTLGAAVSGGYEDQRIGEDRFRVAFAGNMFTTRERVEDYLLFRAAELTVEQDRDWFVVVDHEMEHEIEHVVRPDPRAPRSYDEVYGDWRPYWRYREYGAGWSEWNPYRGDPFFTDRTDELTIERYEATAEIRLGRGPIPAGEDKALDAREVMARVGPTLVYPEQ